MASPPKDGKYRISLSLPQLRYALLLLQQDTAESTAKLRETLQAQLKLLAFKAQEGITSPAYAAAERATLEQKLGLDDPATRRELAYRKWSGSPALCTAQETADARLYRYEHDMMTSLEEEEYERATES